MTSTHSSERTEPSNRPALTRDRVIEGAVVLADGSGVHALTIRKLAAALDVKPMTIYHYVASKEAIIDGMVDAVFAEIALPPTDTDWRAAMRQRATSAREVLARHPWATPLMESRHTPGPATLHHHDAVLGCLRGAGFSIEMTAHAYALIDAFIYGFALQEAGLPTNEDGEMTEVAGTINDGVASEDYPHLTELITEHVLEPGYDFGTEFDFGLELILESLARTARATG